jgi:hypothetical protein
MDGLHGGVGCDSLGWFVHLSLFEFRQDWKTKASRPGHTDCVA